MRKEIRSELEGVLGRIDNTLLRYKNCAVNNMPFFDIFIPKIKVFSLSVNAILSQKEIEFTEEVILLVREIEIVLMKTDKRIDRVNQDAYREYCKLQSTQSHEYSPKFWGIKNRGSEIPAFDEELLEM